MKIAFFSEMSFQGKILRTHLNMRTEFAWMCKLEADHYNLKDTPSQQYDLGIVTIPKKNIDRLSQYPLIENLRKCLRKYFENILK